jgi:hypothetical protein
MDTMSMFSMAGSAFSTLATGYFWLVRNRREKPNLRAYVADREFYLGRGGAENRQIGCKLGLIVANYSILPNSLLGVTLAVKRKDGGWQPVQGMTFDPQTPLPFNIPPMQTVLLRMNGYLSFPNVAEIENSSSLLPGYLERHLADPRQYQVELRALNNRRQTQVVAAA